MGSNHDQAIQQLGAINDAIGDLTEQEAQQVLQLTASLRLIVQMSGITDYPLQVLAMTKATQDLIMEHADLENDTW